jgi:hypothetical protein
VRRAVRCTQHADPRQFVEPPFRRDQDQGLHRLSEHDPDIGDCKIADRWNGRISLRGAADRLLPSGLGVGRGNGRRGCG